MGAGVAFPRDPNNKCLGLPTWDIGQRARQLPMHQHLLISRQPLLFFYMAVSQLALPFTMLDASRLTMIKEAGNIPSVMTF